MSDFEIDSFYDVVPEASSVLGGIHRSLKVKAILDNGTASMFADVSAKHAKIYNLLPLGAVEDPRSLVYILFETTNGDKLVLAESWISSFVLVTSTSMTITITDGDLTKSTAISNALKSLGFTNFTIT